MVAYNVTHTKSKLPLLSKHHQSFAFRAAHVFPQELQLNIMSDTSFGDSRVSLLYFLPIVAI